MIDIIDIVPAPVIWITGLSGAGKSSTARALQKLLSDAGVRSTILDGDELRECLGAEDAVSRPDRVRLGLTYGRLANLLANQGHVVIVATISLFNEVFCWNRQNIPVYFDVFLETPIHELRSRDTKGIYGGFDAGRIQSVAGLDMEVDFPVDASLVVKFRSGRSAIDVAKIIFDHLKGIYEN